MKTFKTIEDYKKYTNDFIRTMYSNKDFLEGNGVAVVFSSIINEELSDSQIIFGEPVDVGASICLLFQHLPKELTKAIYESS